MTAMGELIFRFDDRVTNIWYLLRATAGYTAMQFGVAW
jgi:hypothetical protein